MKNRKRFYVLICLAVLMNMLVSTFVYANGTSIVNIINVQIPSVVNEEDNPTLTRMYRIYIENFLNGVISRVDNSGVHVRMGSVLRPATVTKDISAGFWAARYAKANDGTHSAVIGMGVNALHLRVGPVASYDPFNPTAWTPRGISLHIKEDFDHAGGTFSNAGIYTNIPGGTGIFGGWNAAFVGSPVQFLDTDGVWKSLDIYFGGNFTRPIPKRLMIVVSKPSTPNGSPNYIEFENWAAGDIVGGMIMFGNGRVLVNYPNGVRKHVADVIQRVSGTGRFVGSEYAEVGRIRAAHPGVICFSTSPKVGYTTNPNQRGAFQFVPANHAKYLNYNLQQDSIIGRAQWGIVAHIGADRSLLNDARYIINGRISYDPIWEAVSPLFGQYIKPKHIPGDLANSTFFRVSSDFGNTWSHCPAILGVTDPSMGSPVNNWTNIRVYMRY